MEYQALLNFFLGKENYELLANEATDFVEPIPLKTLNIVRLLHNNKHHQEHQPSLQISTHSVNELPRLNNHGE